MLLLTGSQKGGAAAGGAGGIVLIIAALIGGGDEEATDANVSPSAVGDAQVSAPADPGEQTGGGDPSNGGGDGPGSSTAGFPAPPYETLDELLAALSWLVDSDPADTAEYDEAVFTGSSLAMRSIDPELRRRSLRKLREYRDQLEARGLRLTESEARYESALGRLWLLREPDVGWQIEIRPAGN